jgi:KUP system potassium uptake protein
VVQPTGAAPEGQGLSQQAQAHHPEEISGARLAGLAFGAVGVVYGDIGTSPLYALKECFGEHGVTVNEANVFGVLSLVF